MIKNEIMRKWNLEFPNLKPYKKNSLMEILGLVLIGVELKKLPRSDSFRPYFVAYPLWKVEDFFSEPIFTQEIFNSKGFQFDIPYLKSEDYFKEAVECTKNQIQLDLNSNVSTESFIKFVNSQFAQTLIASSPVGQAKLYELKVLTAVYCGDKRLFNQTIDELQKVGSKWSPEMFDWKFGKFDIWLQSLKSLYEDNRSFIASVEKNKGNANLSILNKLELCSG